MYKIHESGGREGFSDIQIYFGRLSYVGRGQVDAREPPRPPGT